MAKQFFFFSARRTSSSRGKPRGREGRYCERTQLASFQQNHQITRRNIRLLSEKMFLLQLWTLMKPRFRKLMTDTFLKPVLSLIFIGVLKVIQYFNGFMSSLSDWFISVVPPIWSVVSGRPHFSVLKAVLQCSLWDSMDVSQLGLWFYGECFSNIVEITMKYV